MKEIWQWTIRWKNQIANWCKGQFIWWMGQTCWVQRYAIIVSVLAIILAVTILGLVGYGLFCMNSDIGRNLILLVAGIVGWYFLARRTKATEQNTKIAEHGLTIDRLNRAIEQLASDKLSVRLGAIHGLEQIFKLHVEERYKIIQILAAFVHDSASISSDTRTIDTRGKHSDIEEAIRVLAEVTEPFPDERQAFFDLHFTNLSGLGFSDTNLSNFRFLGTNFSNSLFWWVDFTNAGLQKVNFSRVSIRNSKGLTREQLEQAFYWKGEPPIEFPEELLQHLLEIEKPQEKEKPNGERGESQGTAK